MTTDHLCGFRIAAAREARGLTRQRLAESIGALLGHSLSTSIVGLWENEQHVPRGDHLCALASALGVPIQDLFAPGPGRMQDRRSSCAARLRARTRRHR